VNILIIDDHAIVRDGLKRLLRPEARGDIVEAASGREALSAARSDALAIIILDLNLPDLGGLELLGRLRQLSKAPVLVLSMHAEPLYVSRALDAGASGYLTKNAAPEEIIAAVRKIVAGGRYIEHELAQHMTLQADPSHLAIERLADRDLEIMRLLAQGRSLAEIATALGLGYKTIANTCTQIKTKLGVARTADLVRLAVQAGLG
jgi:two-component system invasion response regulator UvrY